MSEANSVVDGSECSKLINISDNGNDISPPSSSTLKVSSGVKISPKKRSNSPEEVNLCSKVKGKHFRNNKRKKGNLYNKFLGEESTKNKNSKVQKEELLCQTSQTSSALRLTKSEVNSKQKMDLVVPNINENSNTPSSSMNSVNLKPTSNDNNNPVQEPAKLKSKKRKKSLPKWSAKKNVQIDETTKTENDCHHTKDNTQKSNQEHFEEELICSICSEIFISAVTLNCSHSFCKYCITEWRKNHITCPICRQNISSQNSTLVLDKCIERLMETSKEEIKNHRKEIMESRAKYKEPNTLPTSTLNTFGDENGWVDLDVSSDDEYGFYDDDELDDTDYYDEDDYYDEEGEYEDGEHEPDEENEYNVDHEHDEDGEGEGDYDEEGVQEGEEDYEEGEEYEEDEYADTDGEDEESEEEDEEIEYNEEYSYEESEDDESDGSENDNKCFNCGIEGHFARECPTRLAYTGISGAYYGGYGSCFRCKEEGHWANGCPN